ncbi:flavodoxin family protein [Mitsuaria sp. 7]|uniref:flavodoxin family protein n=1 Tax=Mitsuaria sp. 7 TaxID=1658665 RepID=UPI0007DDCE32|nr:flavodoxin family protein [Mitsuaria sp. 7]ANH68843.1 NADPH-dependent FMN reductase [Mitsuaria sp. 7]
MTVIRKGQQPAELTREQFHERYMRRFQDPAYRVEHEAIARLETIAFEAMKEGRKAPVTRPAGNGFKDPSYEVAVEWLDTHQRLKMAQQRWSDPATRSRVLLVCGSDRNDGTCPGEMSKTWRMTQIAKEQLSRHDVIVDVLDLSLITSEYGRQIHPCKGCVSTAMPLCHWPCSCYPNHALDQSSDWMNEIYERWVSAHGVILLTPTYWYQSPSALKLMIDRLVCADGGNPDPTSTHGKKVEEAKAIEEQGWDYPKHLEGRTYGLVVHGDVAGVEAQRRNLGDWLDWMGLVDAGNLSQLDRYIGYFEPYFNSHEALDRDEALQNEVRLVADLVGDAVKQLREGKLPRSNRKAVRPK